MPSYPGPSLLLNPDDPRVISGSMRQLDATPVVLPKKLVNVSLYIPLECRLPLATYRTRNIITPPQFLTPKYNYGASRPSYISQKLSISKTAGPLLVSPRELWLCLLSRFTMTGTKLWQNPCAAVGALYTRFAGKRTFSRICYSLAVIAIIYNLYESAELRKALDDRPQLKLETVTQTEPDFQHWSDHDDITIQRNGTEKATMVMLVRNREIREALASIRSVEDRFNKNFHYPWTFLNDKPFTKEVCVSQSLVDRLGTASDMADSLSNTQLEWPVGQWNMQWYRKNAGQCPQTSTWL